MYEMFTDPNPSEEVESPSTNFGDLRGPLGCEYVVNVHARPDGSAVVGLGSHRYEFRFLVFVVMLF